MKNTNKDVVYSIGDFVNIQGKWVVKTGFVLCYYNEDYLDEVVDVCDRKYYPLSEAGRLDDYLDEYAENCYWTGPLRKSKRSRRSTSHNKQRLRKANPRLYPGSLTQAGRNSETL